MEAVVWFDGIPVIGKMRAAQAAAKLREVGEDEAAEVLQAVSGAAPPQVFGMSDWFRGKDRGWQHVAHTFGFIAPFEPGRKDVPIEYAGNIKPNPKLNGSRVNISLDGLRVADYPGRGARRVLFDFYAQNQTVEAVEHVHFNSTYRAIDGERVAVIGYPIFRGLNVGPEGLAFKCFTVNVQNEQDEALLRMMESDVFRAGLQLASKLQPAIGPLSALAVALTKSIATRHRNVPVQDFYIGLDIVNRPTGLKLAEGSYIAVQIPESFRRAWKWKDWIYEPETGQVVAKNNTELLIPYNYVILGVALTK
jgi:hypothetical protein